MNHSSRTSPSAGWGRADRRLALPGSAAGGLAAYVLVFATGMAGLMHQVAWQRYLGRLLGGDAVATAMVLGVFLGGLAVGYAAFGAFSSRVRNGYRAYALAEAVIGLWGLGFPRIFQAVTDLAAGWSFQPTPVLLAQGLACCVLLIGLPTACMGSTVPLLTRAMSASLGSSTAVHARIYSVNTAGAFVGALLAGFLLVPWLGLPQTLRLAGIINLCAGAVFLCLGRVTGMEPGAGGPPGLPDPPGLSDLSDLSDLSNLADPPSPPGNANPAGHAGMAGSSAYGPASLLSMALLSGYATMSLENVLIRVVNHSLGSSSYSFSLVVAVFILAIALGSWLVSRLIPAGARSAGLAPQALFLSQAGAAALLVAVYAGLDTWPYWAHLLRIAQPRSVLGFWLLNAGGLVLLGLVLSGPVALLGAGVPLMFHEYRRTLADVGRHSGRLLAINTTGNLLGSLVGGMLLYTLVDTPQAYLMAVAALAVSAALSARPLSLRVKASAALLVALAALLMAVALLAARPPWYDHTRFVLGTFRINAPLPYSLAGPRTFFHMLGTGAEVLMHKDGPTGSVAVVANGSEDLDDAERDMAVMVNGKSDSAVLADAQTLRLIAHLPALLARQRERVLVVGLGTGVTAGEFGLYDDVRRIDVAEISPTVAQALPLFGNHTHMVHADPRLAVQVADALRVLQRGSEPWDIIASEPSNPWVMGVDMLFTREFYQAARRRLAPGGVLLQWMHVHDVSPAMVFMVLRTLGEVFPACRVFISQPNDVLLVASAEPLGVDALDRAQAALERHPRVRASLAAIGLPTLDALLLRELWNSALPAPWPADTPVQTMDHPRLHYMAGRSQFLGERFDPAMLLAGTALNPGSFLLARRPGWPAFPALPADYDGLVASTRTAARPPNAMSTGNMTTGDMTMDALLPTGQALVLRAYLADPGGRALPPEQRLPHPAVVELAMRQADKPGPRAPDSAQHLPQDTPAQRAAALCKAVAATRTWLTPYPLEGLAAALADAGTVCPEVGVGTASEADPEAEPDADPGADPGAGMARRVRQ